MAEGTASSFSNRPRSTDAGRAHHGRMTSGLAIISVAPSPRRGPASAERRTSRKYCERSRAGRGAVVERERERERERGRFILDGESY